MKNILKYSTMLVLAVILLASCSDKESEGLSRVTYYCDLRVTPANDTFVVKGAAFNGYAATATENEADVSSKITNTLATKIDVNTPGAQTLTYSVLNADDLPTSISRKVYVYESAVAGDLESGKYNVQPNSSRTALGATPDAVGNALYKDKPELCIFKTKANTYWISDLFGGYYYVRSGYPPASGNFEYKDGKFKLIDSEETIFGDHFSAINGSYDAATKTLTIAVDWESGYTFHLTIKKQ
ncbi:hypothetical protein AGMMS4956_05540 [Bacteroidia bacterium]|nr:hypothetical protein AGMMS4956_05540 [Bacteroidia bacterium]